MSEHFDEDLCVQLPLTKSFVPVFKKALNHQVPSCVDLVRGELLSYVCYEAFTIMKRQKARQCLEDVHPVGGCLWIFGFALGPKQEDMHFSSKEHVKNNMKKHVFCIFY